MEKKKRSFTSAPVNYFVRIFISLPGEALYSLNSMWSYRQCCNYNWNASQLEKMRKYLTGKVDLACVCILASTYKRQVLSRLDWNSAILGKEESGKWERSGKDRHIRKEHKIATMTMVRHLEIRHAGGFFTWRNDRCTQQWWDDDVVAGMWVKIINICTELRIVTGWKIRARKAMRRFGSL